MRHWNLVEADLHEHFGIDLGDDELLASRSWRWLQLRCIALLSTKESRLRRKLFPDKEQKTR